MTGHSETDTCFDFLSQRLNLLFLKGTIFTLVFKTES